MEENETVINESSTLNGEPSKRATEQETTKAGWDADLFGSDASDQSDSEVLPHPAHIEAKDDGWSDDHQRTPLSEQARKEESDSMLLDSPQSNTTRMRKDVWPEVEADQTTIETKDHSMNNSVENLSPEITTEMFKTSNVMPPVSDDNKYNFITLPSFISINPTPYDATTFDERTEVDSNLPEQARKLKLENTIRWRYRKDEQGNQIKQTNTYLVRWADNSTSLMIGKEFFNLMSKPTEAEWEYLAVQRPQEGFLQTQVRFTHRLTLQPHSTQSAVHRRLTKAISGKHKKTSRTIMVPTMEDPELVKLEAERRENERIKAQRRMENRKRSIEARYDYGLTEDALEAEDYSEEEEEEVEEVEGEKNQRWGDESVSESEKDMTSHKEGTGEENEEDLEAEQSKRILESKKLRTASLLREEVIPALPSEQAEAVEESVEGAKRKLDSIIDDGEGSGDDGNEDVVISKKAKVSRRKILLSDDEEGDEEEE